ncbi:CAP domain-containing protein [Ideonella livida]|uniref:SCP-like extracellular n=1 Tax=Ideonella livida TaxID=2707176 RepID=A0A7C9TIR1_9BURK|nr:CAP domain-containing protein [Ideonella livida]NDY91258.1 SCP-like extracellular [Ideonella livida]
MTLPSTSCLALLLCLWTSTAAHAQPSLPATAGAQGLSTAQRADLVGEHNRWRTRVGVPPLRWSETLAASAQRWATRLATQGCQLQHSHGAEGENIYWGGPLTWSDGRVELQPVTGAAVASAWGGESADYRPATNDCAPGRVCGHYTQMVWADSQELGCGRQVCADQAQIWVCQYLPAGNIVGRRPY